MTKNARVYTEENKKWIIDNYSAFDDYFKFTTAFNQQFNTSKSINAIQQFMYKKLKVRLVTDKTKHWFSKKEEDWLVKNLNNYSSYEGLTTAFNEKFNRNKSPENISDKCSKGLGLIKENSTKFKEGHTLRNLPVGTIRSGGNGCKYIKVKDVDSTKQRWCKLSGYQEPYWLPVQKKIWIDHYGEIGADEMIIFLDGDRDNLAIDNLACIDRKTLVRLAKSGWHSENKDLTKTGIYYWNLYYSLKNGGIEDEFN